MSTEAEATNLVREHFLHQIERAETERALPNEVYNGDRQARLAFWLLLSPAAQRALFLLLCKRRQFWPRIRTLVGAPPFSFLRPEDNAVLNAGGIALGRVNMAAETTIHSSQEIGEGQFVDANRRAYRWVFDDNTKSTEIPSVRVRGAKRVVLDVRLPKMRNAERSAIFKTSRGKHNPQINYPRPGDTLALSLNHALGGGSTLPPAPLRLIVRSVESRGQRSPVARLYCSATH